MRTLSDHLGSPPALRLVDGRVVPADNVTTPSPVAARLDTDAVLDILAACLRREGLDGDRVARSTAAVIRHMRELNATRSGPHGYASLSVSQDEDDCA